MRSVLKIDPQEKRTERRHTDRRGGRNVNPEAETGEMGVLRPQQDTKMCVSDMKSEVVVMLPQAKESRELLTAPEA